MLLITKVIWPQKITGRSKNVHYIEKKHNFRYPTKKTLGICVEPNKPINSKTITMLALRTGRCLLHHKGIENYQTIFFHVTAGNVKLAMCPWPIPHPLHFLYKTRLYCDNAISEKFVQKVEKKIIRDSRILVDKKAFDFVLSWTFIQN